MLRFKGLVGRVLVGVRSWGMHYVCESPHRDGNTRMCVGALHPAKLPLTTKIINEHGLMQVCVNL